MLIELRFFAALRETLGVAAERVEVPAEVATVGALRDWLRARGGVWADALDLSRPVRAARNQRAGQPDTPLADGDEIAFFPPVTGG
ncbi:molybdopterin converting factor subunit 1 [Chitinasiproducens palmae]|uniref:Molybdopterin synthase sulfur carrier subunit n=1 Tax=Chitinasiproducens palmae TaxID=1770053 RepID=A0A1H2PLV1_9BURK|nr:molybdopterin converting factor subunit 1 [Chitinasiproducens palmae]SDV47524.1 molybdopterin synthase subunit MoaD [Chitinasiproducens palmae]